MADSGYQEFKGAQENTQSVSPFNERKLLSAFTSKSDKDNKKDAAVVNPWVFYGVPFILIVASFLVFFLFIYPTVVKIFDFKEQTDIINQNLDNARESVSNLNNFYKKSDEVKTIDGYLKQVVPEENRLPALIDKLQKTVSDFSLEGKVVPGITQSNTSFNSDLRNVVGGNNASTSNNSQSNQNNSDNSSFFRELSSSESRYLSESISSASDAYAVEIGIKIKGKKSRFLAFLQSLKNFTPTLSIRSVDYSETLELDEVDKTVNLDDPVVIVTLQIQFYTLRSNTDYKPPKILIYSKDDPALLKTIGVEQFDLNPDIWNFKSKIGTQAPVGPANNTLVPAPTGSGSTINNANQQPTSTPASSSNNQNNRALEGQSF